MKDSAGKKQTSTQLQQSKIPRKDKDLQLINDYKLRLYKGNTQKSQP
jgi:hypothetical protein